MPTTGLDGLDHVLSEGFQETVRSMTRTWDKEWMRYFSDETKAYQMYFFDISDEHHRLMMSTEEIATLPSEKLFHAELSKKLRPAVWLPGNRLVGKIVLEMGCGPGILGRIAGRFSKAYIGIDASKFALSIARLTSPANCTYRHLSQTRRIAALRKSVDVCVSRYFFIHHNYEDSLWILKFLRDLTKPGGTILADFFSNPASVTGEHRRRATAPLNPDNASALYDFTDDDIARIAGDSGLTIERIDPQPELQRRFARFRLR